MANELSGVISSGVLEGKTLECRTYPPSDSLTDLVAGKHPELCFLDCCSDPEEAFRVVGHLSGQPSKIPVIALLSGNDPELVLRFLRRGAAAFLLRPFSEDGLRTALSRVAGLFPRDPATPASSGKVYCVIPAKGSCGATTIASNLACQAKQIGAAKVLLADLDPLTSTLAFLWKLQSQYSFRDALSRVNELDDDVWKALVVNYRGVDILLSPETPASCIEETHYLGGLVDHFRRAYDAIFLDLGNPYGAWNIKLAKASDGVLLVVTSEVPAVYGAQRALAYLERNGIQRSRVGLVVNRARKDFGLDPDDIEQALGTEIMHVLPDDRDAIAGALMEAKPVPPGCQFGRSLAELAARLVQRKPVARKPQTGGLLSLFSRA